MSLSASVVRELCCRNIVVIGDIILDHYIWGAVDRISPEAPVPVVNVKSDTYRLGGAANVVANICRLKGNAHVISIVGQDEGYERLRGMLQEIGANVEGLISDDGRETIVKTRVIAHHQQIVRIDRENEMEMEEEHENQIIGHAEAAIPNAEALIVSDYDKGAMSKRIIEKVLACAKEHGKPVVVDPKFRNFWDYRGATVVKPNVKEIGAAIGMPVTDENSLLSAGNTVLEKLELDALLVTRGENGMSLFQDSDNRVTHIPALAKDVFDVTGAGDTVVAVFALALAAGTSILEAAKLSNYAAAITVGKIGTASVAPEELVAALDEDDGLRD